MVGACIDSEPALDMASRFHRPESEAAGQASLPCPATSGSRLPRIDPRIGARRANQFVFCQFACPAPFAKIFLFSPDPNQMHIRVVPSHRGADRASSRTRGGMRWTRERQAHWQSQGEMNLVSGQLACKMIGA